MGPPPKELKDAAKDLRRIRELLERLVELIESGKGKLP